MKTCYGLIILASLMISSELICASEPALKKIKCNKYDASMYVSSSDDEDFDTEDQAHSACVYKKETHIVGYVLPTDVSQVVMPLTTQNLDAFNFDRIQKELKVHGSRRSIRELIYQARQDSMQSYDGDKNSDSRSVNSSELEVAVHPAPLRLICPSSLIDRDNEK